MHMRCVFFSLPSSSLVLSYIWLNGTVIVSGIVVFLFNFQCAFFCLHFEGTQTSSEWKKNYFLFLNDEGALFSYACEMLKKEIIDVRTHRGKYIIGSFGSVYCAMVSLFVFKRWSHHHWCEFVTRQVEKRNFSKRSFIRISENIFRRLNCSFVTFAVREMDCYYEQNSIF